MKYKVLLVGRNKVIMEDFFQYLADDFEMQTSSMRIPDIQSHIDYFRPNVLLYCMSKEEKERVEVVTALKVHIKQNRVVLILTGNQDECEAFQKTSDGMAALILKKPITARSIKEKIIEFLDGMETVEIETDYELSPQSTPQDIIIEPSSKAETENEPVKKHVLVVDDDPMMLKLIKEQLKDTYTVATAISGAIALKFLENKKTNLIILDYEMPGEKGPQVLEKIRNNPQTAHLPVIFLTGVKDKEKIRKLVGLRPQGYLLKPIESDRLIKCIKDNIG